MKVIPVTSSVTYVRDNYLAMIRHITDPDVLQEDLEIAAVVLLRVSPTLLFKNIFGLAVVGAPRVAGTLLCNFILSKTVDSRVSLLEKRKIPVIKAGNMNDAPTISKLCEYKPDLIVNMRTRNIYKSVILNLPSIGCINIHHGLLPEYRGTMCDLWARLAGRPAGFSIHWMNEKIDDGLIIIKREIETAGISDYLDIPMKSSLQEGPALIESLRLIAVNGRNCGIPNVSVSAAHTRNPTIEQIKQIRRRKIRL